MKEVIKFKSHGKGAFAFSNEIKVLKGSRCALARNASNTHDANCIQIRAPLFGSNVEGANFEHGEHVGHVAKECAAVLAKLMDAGFEAITATPSVNSDYIIDYQFSAMLSYTDTNRSKLGYDIDIIVHSNKSASWVDAMFLFLHHQGFEPVMMI